MLGFRHATDRQTKAYIITVGDHTLFVSYETVIGYAGPAGRFRRDNDWGPTTGRHINEMGIREFEVVPRSEFNARVEKAMGGAS